MLGGPWATALASIARATPRSDVAVTEITAPEALAPFAAAYAADIDLAGGGVDGAHGTGRFIVLHDPSGPEPWEGVFRVVCYVQAPLERDIGTDPVFADVAWSWLLGCLDGRQAAFHAASGTATVVLSTGFGGLADQDAGAQIEVRASWTPRTADLGPHLLAWADFLAMVAGLPPEGVAAMPERRAASGR